MNPRVTSPPDKGGGSARRASLPFPAPCVDAATAHPLTTEEKCTPHTRTSTYSRPRTLPQDVNSKHVRTLHVLWHEEPTASLAGVLPRRARRRAPGRHGARSDEIKGKGQ